MFPQLGNEKLEIEGMTFCKLTPEHFLWLSGVKYRVPKA